MVFLISSTIDSQIKIIIKVSNYFETHFAHVKEIPDTRLLVSFQHRIGESANLQVFDVSQKGRANKIYSFEEVVGCKATIKI